MKTKTQIIKPKVGFKILFNSIPDAAFIHDMKGRFLEVNEVACKRLGYSKKELLKMGPKDIDAPEFSQQVAEKIKELKEKGEAILETVHVTKKGEELEVELSSRVINFDGKEAILSIARDISERKEVRKKIQENRERYAYLFEHLTSGIAVYRPVKNGLNFKIVDINRAGEKISKIDVKKVKGKLVTEVFPGIKKMGLFDAIKEVNETGKPIDFPITEYKEENLSIWYDNYIYKLPTGEIVAIFDDVTAKKKLDREIKQERDFSRNLVEVAQIGVLVLNHEGKIFLTNPYFEKFSGYGLDEIKGKRWLDVLLSNKVKKAKQKAIINFLNEKESIQGQNFGIVDKNGKEKQIEISKRKISNTNGGFYLIIAEDVTERNVFYERLIRSENRFRHLFENMKSGVVIYKVLRRGENFIFKEFNRAAEKIDNLERWDVVDKNIGQVFPGIEETELFKAIKKVYQTGDSKFVPTFIYKEGEMVSYRENYIYKLAGSEVVVIYDDLTEKKKAEEELKEKVEELEKINRFTIGRELKMIELKEQLKKLEKETTIQKEE